MTFCWGASRGAAFGDIDDFRRAGLDVHLATLDGSTGQPGTVIDLLDGLFPASAGETDAPRHVACCGPDGMMAAVSRWSEGRGLGCHVSLEAPMACGIGICFTCVARVKDPGGGWDYKRAHQKGSQPARALHGRAAFPMAGAAPYRRPTGARTALGDEKVVRGVNWAEPRVRVSKS